LQPGRIDVAEIIGSPTDVSLRARIEAHERQYFEATEVSVTSTHETWFLVRLLSLNKPTESGYLNLLDGSRVFYRYVGDNAGKLHSIFGTYDGPVRVFATAHMDDSLKVVHLDVMDIERAQGELFPVDAPDEGGDEV
jgi:hypothetical protein